MNPMDDRKQFTFYRSFWDAIKCFPQKDRLPILEAIISYGLDGETPGSLSQSQSGIFLLIKPVLDSGRKRASSGKQGGSKKKANDKQDETEKEEEIEKEVEIEGEKEKKQIATREGRSFTLFWEDYPNKADRYDAWEAWKALNPDGETVRAIKAGLDAWKQSGQWLDDGGRFIPSAAKWLSKRRWECPPPPAAAGKKAVPMGASGQLGQAELEAIQRVLAHPLDYDDGGQDEL